MLLEISLYRYF